mgnify:CR=1 FL=1
MDPTTTTLIVFSILELGVVAAAVLIIVLYMRIVFKEINDDSARYSRCAARTIKPNSCA